MPVVAPHVPGLVGPEDELRHPDVVIMCVQCVQCVQGVPGVVVRHVGPLAYVGMKASPGGEVGGMAVAEVPLTNLNTTNLPSWLCKKKSGRL